MDTDLRIGQHTVRSLAQAAEAGDKAAYTGLFRQSAAMFLPHRPPLLGRQQIGDWFDDFPERAVLVLDSYEQERLDIVGDVAMVRSHAIGHDLVKSTWEQVSFDQKYLDVLRYDRGDWYMAYHVASSSTIEPGLRDRDWESK